MDFLELSAPGRGDEVDPGGIEAGSAVLGKTIRTVEEESPRVRIVALKRGPDAISLIPDSATTIALEGHLVVIGERSSLKKLTASIGA